jgi:NAD(P)H-hydrate epimerase
LTLRPLSREELRSIDGRASNEIGMPLAVLMENAGRGAAGLLRDRFAVAGRPLPRVLACCGPGNNGGDGAVLARHLDIWGFPIHVVWFAEPSRLRGEAAVQWTILDHARIPQSACRTEAEVASLGGGLGTLIRDADVVVDALLGTGLTRPVEGLFRTAIEAMNQGGKDVLSIDLPSGLDADLGSPLGVAVHAKVTATFVARKLGFDAPGAHDYTGEIVVLDIGVPRRLLEPFQD